MSERYSVQSIGEGEAFVFDAQTEGPVMTQDGSRTYVAPLANAQWTADMLNRAEARKSAPEPEPTSEPVRPNPAALLHVATPLPDVAHVTRADAPRHATPEPVVRPVEKVDYPRMAGKAIGSIGVLSTRLASIGRWLDALEDGSVSPEFAMRELRKAQTEAHKYAEDIYEELSAR